MKRTLIAKKTTGLPAFETLEERQHFSAYPVSSTGDSGPGTLREAILDVNADPGSGGDTIVFDLANHSGLQQTIKLTSPLPAVRHSVTIDGSSQNNALQYPIALVGSGLTIIAGNSSISRLSIAAGSNGANDILLQTGGNDLVQGCYLTVPNSGSGIKLLNSSNDLIGEASTNGTAAQVDVIKGSGGGDGIVVSASNSAAINGIVESGCFYGLYVDKGADGTFVTHSTIDSNTTEGVVDYGEGTLLAYDAINLNGDNGVWEDGNQASIQESQLNSNKANGVLIAPAAFGSTEWSTLTNDLIEHNAKNGVVVEASGHFLYTNTISDNGEDGILVTDNARSVQYHQNSIFANGSAGIDLEHGGNNLAAAPTITSVTASNGKITITGTYHGLPNDYQPYFEFYVSSAGTSGSGQTYLGALGDPDGLGANPTLQTDANGNLSFTVTFASSATSGVVTATATSGYFYDESAFSAPVNIIAVSMKQPLPPVGLLPRL